MFTGIIQDLGVVLEKVIKENTLTLAISTKLKPTHLALGASIACNGCCLTVTKTKDDVFYVDLGPETISLTRFSQVKIGDKINLEPALRVGDALGGHNVSGHVDGSFPVIFFEKTQSEFWKLSLSIPKKFGKFMISKGSLAVAGISLTIASISSLPNDQIRVDFMIIPHTYDNTILQFISANNNNLEVEFDQSAKAIASLFEGMIINYSQIHS
jgi:riboflavin synthase